MARDIVAALGEIEPQSSVGVFRRELGCLFEIGLSLGERAAGEIDATSVHVAGYIFRIDTDRLAIAGDRAIVVLLGEIRVAAIVEGGDVLGIKPDRLVVVGDGAVVIVPAGVHEAAVAVGEGVLGIEPDRLVVVGDGAVVIALGPGG